MFECPNIALTRPFPRRLQIGVTSTRQTSVAREPLPIGPFAPPQSSAVLQPREFAVREPCWALLLSPSHCRRVLLPTELSGLEPFACGQVQRRLAFPAEQCFVAPPNHFVQTNLPEQKLPNSTYQAVTGPARAAREVGESRHLD